jgi:predicted restriction endonuclease
MAMNDKKRLEAAANKLADGLRAAKLGVLRIRRRIVMDGPQHYNGGWSDDVAYWPNRPSIAISLDRYTSSSQRDFWVGFWSSEQRPIRDLYERLPKDLEPVRTFETSMAEPKNGIWVLKQPLKRSLFGRPIAEHYEEDEQYFGFYDSSKSLDVAAAVNFISSVIIAQEDDADDESVDIRLIARSNDLTETEKDQLIRARRGQGNFRKALELIWTAGCPVTGHAVPELLRASHIMPWREADNRQRLDPYNGILLCANLDALFDKYLISFSNDGKLLISDLVPAEERRLLRLNDDKSIPLVDEQRVYLKHHRSNFERRRSLGR